MMNSPHLAALGCLLAVSASLSAAETFRLGTRSEEIPEAGAVKFTTLSAGLNEYVFLPPPGWKTEPDSKTATVTWTSPDFRSLLRLRVPLGDSETIPKPNADELRVLATESKAENKIVEESPCYTAGLAGLAFDIERTTDTKAAIRMRRAFVPVAGGFVEFTVSGPADEFQNRQSDLSRFLNSFRATRATPNSASSQ